MTEQDWLTCADPEAMLEFLDGKGSHRKLRLLAAGCCRRVWHLLPDMRSREAVEVAERLADGITNNTDEGIANNTELLAAGKNAEAAMREVAITQSRCHAAYAACNAVTLMIHVFICGIIIKEITQALECVFDETGTDEMYAVALAADDTHRDVLREIFGNPFRPVTLSPSWLSPTVLSLAQTIYEERAFDRMPILADALEEAGCDNTDILTHCRSRGEHVRGCWALDLVLGRG